MASFHDYISKILAKKFNIFVIIYWDDIFIYTKDPNQAYVNAIWWIFKELRKHGFFYKTKKVSFL